MRELFILFLLKDPNTNSGMKEVLVKTKKYLPSHDPVETVFFGDQGLVGRGKDIFFAAFRIKRDVSKDLFAKRIIQIPSCLCADGCIKSGSE